MRFIRKLFFTLSVGLLVWLGIYTYNRLTDGFSIYQMSSSLPAYPQFSVPLTLEKKEELKQILDQDFYYLGKGCQFYVFASADKKYVIKFLKHKHLRPFSWLNSLPMPQALRKRCGEKIARRTERVERLFASCKLAYEKLPNETALLYIHINRTPALEKKITLHDKLGCKHTINIDDYEYFVQRKATPVKEVFATSSSQEIPQRVQQLMDLVLARCEKGICDRDRSFVQNVAFLDKQAIFTDFGQFYEDPLILQKEEQDKDLNKRITNLRAWTERFFPNYAPLITQ